MAKPFADKPGSGFHMHFSILDENSFNVFDDGSDSGTALMKNCISGILTNMKQSTILFAPHLNSYRRMTPGHHAPTSALWGYENRTAAVRVPGGDSINRRIEHRVAGADCNPYLVTTAVLGAALNGIESQTFPPSPTEGNCYEVAVPDIYSLPRTWLEAVDLFRIGDRIGGCIPPQMHDMIVRAKTQELAVFGQKITPFEYQSYLEQV
jgi:glutamine synthetase